MKYLGLFNLALSLDLSGEKDIQFCENGFKKSFRVKFLRESYPPLTHIPMMKFIMIGKDMDSIEAKLPLKGCCLQLLDSIYFLEEELEQVGNHCADLNKFLSTHHEGLRFTYDCPIRAGPPEDLLLLPRPETPPISTLCRPDEAHQVVGPWTIIIGSSMYFNLCIFHSSG